MICCSAWVPRNAVAAVPKYVEPTPEQLEQWKRDAEDAGVGDAAAANIDKVFGEGDDDDDSASDTDEGGAAAGGEEKELTGAAKARQAAHAMRDQEDDDDVIAKRYGLDTYDDDPEMDMGASLLQGVGLMQHESNADDPYMTVKDDEEDDAEDEEDVVIRPTDAVILTGKHEDEVNSLEVNIYDTVNGVLYLHHDVMLPSFPLCVSWLDCKPGKPGAPPGNFAAVGTMQTAIEIWDMDTMDAMEPEMTLGGEDIEATLAAAGGAAALKKSLKNDIKKKKKNPKMKPVLKPDSHADAVLGLAWNHMHRNILASASADGTVKLWDLHTGLCAHTLRHHSDKVQSLQWNPLAPTMLLTGSFDRTAAVLNMQNPEVVHKWSLPADVECAAWNPHDANFFMVTTETGNLLYFDVRVAGAPVFNVSAHPESCTGLSFNPSIPGCFATGSLDKTVKVWDLSAGQPRLVCSREVKIGNVFCVDWSAEMAFVLSAGGSQGRLCVWDTAENRHMRECFGARVPTMNFDEYESAADGAAAAVLNMSLQEPGPAQERPAKEGGGGKKKKKLAAAKAKKGRK